MKEINKIIAGICAFLFVFSSAAALLLFSIERKAFSSETYKQAFQEQGLYAQTPSLLATVLTEMPNNSETSSLLSLLTRDELALVISSLLPPAEIEAVTNDALDSTFAFINSEADAITLSMIPFKNSLAGEGGVRAFNQILQAQPDCTPDQILQMGLNFLSSDPQLMMCNPPDEVAQLMTSFVQAQLVTLKIPDMLTLITADQISASNFRTRLDGIRAVMKLTPLLPLFLLVVLTVFAVRSLNDWLKWWGIPFLVTGLATIFLAIIGAPIVRFFVEVVILQGNADMPLAISEIIRNVFGSLARQILKPVAIQGLILMFVGGCMAVGAVVLNKILKPSNTGTIAR